MARVHTLTLVCSLAARTARAEPDTEELQDYQIRPPGYVAPEPPPNTATAIPHARRTTRTDAPSRWGGGLRVTGLSGIGALPGVNFGGELAGLVRRDELFVELGLGHWQPEHEQRVTETPDRVALALDVWTLRGGWASMDMPLRAWGLVEVGEVAGARGMEGVVSRMVMGDTPAKRQWRAIGAGLGVAWPMSRYTRLVGSMEIAVPIQRERLMLEQGEAYEPDPLAARYSVGLEVGWR
jgi:hypothetical protein